MNLDIVVVNYKSSEDLKKFVRSLLYHKPGFPVKLIIMNVDPEIDDLVEMRELVQLCSRVGIPAVGIDKRTNVGYGAACNEGGSLGTSEYIGFFNADVELTENALSRCINIMDKNPSWGILGPCQVDDQNRFTAAGILGSRSKPKHRGWWEQDIDQYSDIQPNCPTVSGAALFIRRTLWQELTDCPEWQKVCPGIKGAMMESHYYSETMMCYHAQEHDKGECTYFGPVKIKHQWHKSSPVGGVAELNMAKEREMFRTYCDTMHGGIPCD